MPIPPSGVATLQDPRSTASAKCDVLVAAGWATVQQKTDVLAQHAYLQANWSQLQTQYPGKFIAISNGQVFAATTLYGAETAAKLAFPSNMYVATAVPPFQIAIVLGTDHQ